jgi:hypothetical protein
MIRNEAPRELEAALVAECYIDEHDIRPKRGSLAQRVRTRRRDPEIVSPSRSRSLRAACRKRRLTSTIKQRTATRPALQRSRAGALQLAGTVAVSQCPRGSRSESGGGEAQGNAGGPSGV